MVKTKKFILKKIFENMPSEGDLRLVEEELPDIREGQFLAEAVFLSVDPYMRADVHKLREGHVMIGYQIAKITQSKHKDFPVNKYVIGDFGWQTHTISNGINTIGDMLPYPSLVPDIGSLPLSIMLGMLGITGNAAYFGLFEICKPAMGETVVVSAAGGAIGSHVGQIAKLKGCRVIGITGSDQKCIWLKSIGFDEAFNYKNTSWRNSLMEATPRGVDCYFDNVGGEISSVVIQHMSRNGRVAVCGSISSYNCDIRNLPKATIVQPWVVFQELEIKGFMLARWSSRWNEAVKQNLQWIKEGKIHYRETITNGFENMPKAFVELLKGNNFGKSIVKV